jgi:hypothetical protein
MNMNTSIQHSYQHAYRKTTVNPWTRFINWCEGQESNRLLWTAIAVAGHGCIFTIITVIFILFTGNNFIFWPLAIGAMAACLVSNLAALPTKITIPILAFSVLLDIVIIALCITNGFDLAASYR